MADQADLRRSAMPYMSALYAAALRMTRNPSRRRGPRAGDVPAAGTAGFGGFHEGTNLKAWLYRILTNTFINQYRAKKRRPDQVDLDDVEDFYIFRRLGGLEAAEATRTAETEVLEALPDAEVKEALESHPGAVPDGRDPGGRRGFLLQGDRRHPRRSDRHRDESHPSRKKRSCRSGCGTTPSSNNLRPRVETDHGGMKDADGLLKTPSCGSTSTSTAR